MKDNSKLIKLYSGTEVLVNLLRGKLESSGISVTIQNDSNDSFLRGTPAAIDLFISETDVKKASRVMNEFIRKNKA